MKPAMMRRLETVERSLAPKEDTAVVFTPFGWSDETNEEVDSRIARWRAGENVKDCGLMLLTVRMRRLCV